MKTFFYVDNKTIFGNLDIRKACICLGWIWKLNFRNEKVSVKFGSPQRPSRNRSGSTFKNFGTIYEVTNCVISKFSLFFDKPVYVFIYEHTKASLEERGWSRMSQMSICFFLHPRRCFIASSSATSWATLSLKSANVFWLSEHVRNYGLTTAALWMS